MNDLLFSVFPSENFVDLSLFQCGREKCSPAHSFGPAARNHYLFHYVISGTGRLFAYDKKGETKEYSIKSMQGFMILPDQITTYVADKDMPWEYVWIEFDGLRAKAVVEAAGFSWDQPVYKARSKELRDEMMKEMNYIAENGSSSPFHLIGHLYLFLDYLTRSTEGINVHHSSKLRDFYIHEALVFIEHNFQNDISVEDIADVCGLNRSYFGKIFKEAIGKSPARIMVTVKSISNISGDIDCYARSSNFDREVIISFHLIGYILFRNGVHTTGVVIWNQCSLARINFLLRKCRHCPRRQECQHHTECQ